MSWFNWAQAAAVVVAMFAQTLLVSLALCGYALQVRCSYSTALRGYMGSATTLISLISTWQFSQLLRHQKLMQALFCLKSSLAKVAVYSCRKLFSGGSHS